MQMIYKTEKVGDWVGVVYLSSLGYHWKIYRKTNGKREEVARSYYYTTDKEKAIEVLDANYRIVSGFEHDLFSI